MLFQQKRRAKPVDNCARYVIREYYPPYKFGEICKNKITLDKLLESVYAEEHPELKVGKVNVDEQPQLAAAFGVESIPTLVIIKDGITKEVLVGLHRKEQILEQFN